MWFRMCLSAFLCLCRGRRPEASYEYQNNPFGERCGTDANLCPGLPLGEGFVWRLVNWAAVANRLQRCSSFHTWGFVDCNCSIVCLWSLMARFVLNGNNYCPQTAWCAVTSRVCTNKAKVQLWAVVVLLLCPWKIRPPSEHFGARPELPRLGFCFVF